MNNKIKNILFFSFGTLLLLSGSCGFAAQQPDPANPVQPQPNQPQQEEPPVYQPKKNKYADDGLNNGRRIALKRQIDEIDEEKNLLLKKTTETDQKFGLLETKFNEFQERTEKAKKDAQEAKEQLQKELKEAQDKHSAELQKILKSHTAEKEKAANEHKAAIEQEWKKRISMQQEVRYQLMQGQMPQNVTDAEARLYNAQAAKVEWENSWGKVGADAGMAVVDFGAGTAKLVVAPILVKGLTPKCEEKIQEYVGKTEFQIRAEEISKNEKTMSDTNKRILEAKEKAEEEERGHAREMLQIQKRSALINQFAAACQGGNLHTEDCVKMGKMIDAMLLADLAKCHKESTGKDYVATPANPKR